MAEPLFVYQLMNTELHTLGIFDTLEKARQAGSQLRGEYYQINRIPLNVVGNYGEHFDVVEFYKS
jgi:hypothetical protein